jgi:hypothetical protein
VLKERKWVLIFGLFFFFLGKEVGGLPVQAYQLIDLQAQGATIFSYTTARLHFVPTVAYLPFDLI